VYETSVQTAQKTPRLHYIDEPLKSAENFEVLLLVQIVRTGKMEAFLR